MENAELIGGGRSSRPRGFHPEPLTEPNVKVSLHSALVIQLSDVCPFANDKTG
jgi:hypothetical protein